MFRGINPGGLGVSRPPRFWAGGRRESQGVVDGSGNIIISYHVQEVCSKVVNFEEKYNNLPVNGQFLPRKSNFFLKLPEKIEICRKFAWKKQNIFVKLPEKSKFFGNLPGKIEFCLPGSTTAPDLKSD